MKRVLRTVRDARPHWVGDGFPVRSLFSYARDPEQVSPFLLLDYAEPHPFSPADARRGVGEHPHRGFETVTVVYAGEVEHRDSSGSHGVIGPGDVQWMTAASGVVHEEFHGRGFTQSGGLLEMVQLWVNLPKSHKMSPPRYQAIESGQIPTVELPDGAGRVRVIAGELEGVRGPAKTFTPVGLWDAHLPKGATWAPAIPEGHSAIVLIRQGKVVLNGSEPLGRAQVAIFEHQGSGIQIEASEETQALVMSGQPLGESVAGRGPFVMNTEAELQQAMIDYQTGRMGRLD